jgi:hypothetical protein
VISPRRRPARKRGSRCRPPTAGEKEFGGLKLDQAKRMKELERENAKLKRLVAELSALRRDIIALASE